MTGKTCLLLAGLTLLTSSGLNPALAENTNSEQQRNSVYHSTNCNVVFASSTSDLATQLVGLYSPDCGESGCSEGCDSGNRGLCGSQIGDAWKLDKKEDGIDFGGWWQQGYTSGSTGMFNNIPHKFNTNQAWFYVEKVADGSKGLDVGEDVR